MIILLLFYAILFTCSPGYVFTLNRKPCCTLYPQIDSYMVSELSIINTCLYCLKYIQYCMLILSESILPVVGSRYQ